MHSFSFVREIFRDVAIVSRQVMASPALKAVLQILLVIGNKLNTGTSYGNAEGFRLETLLKIHDVKVIHLWPGFHGNVPGLAPIYQNLRSKLEAFFSTRGMHN